jgi:hypothetical protein
MPRTDIKATPELAIQLSDGQRTYRPGDTIIGSVIRRVHTISPRGWVTIKLYGRAKSKKTVRRNNPSTNTIQTRHYRGRFNFFAPNETCQKLFDGIIHIPPNSGPQAWPFSLTIPTRASPRSVISGNMQRDSYQPLNEGAIAASSLPSSFMFVDEGWRTSFHGFVEYYLEAEFWQENKSSPTIATLPLAIRAPSIPYPLVDFDMKSRTFPSCIKTQRLIPGMEDAELSFRQMAQKFFGSSKVPQFSFSVQVECPAVIQLENPNPIPFKIRVISDRQRTSDIVTDFPKSMALGALKIELKAVTSVICEREHTADGIEMFNIVDTGTLVNPISVPSGTAAEALDLGAILELYLHSDHLNVRGKRSRQFRSLIYPNFITYNIKRTHQLKWEFRLSVVGESIKISGEQPVSVLAAS